ncbi:MAG TPA: HD domain-containing protein [bacterium]
MKAEKLLLHPALREVIRMARQMELPLYLVGGAVRARLHRPEAEIDNADLLVIGDARAFAEAAAAHFKSRAVVVNPHFNTVLVPLKDLELEISGPRDLLKSPPPVLPLPSDPLQRDLMLRDFTINTMAEQLSPKITKIVDPCKGQADLAARVIRTPIEASVTLREDPLRIMRAARLAAQMNFSIAPELLQAMHDERRLLPEVSAERKTGELLKILQTKKPSIGFKLLYMTGVLEVVFPDIAALAGLKQDKRHRHKDVFEHTLKVVDSVAETDGNLATRIAALLHDVGKPATRRYDPEAGWTFHGHEVVGERAVKRLGREWRLPGALTEDVSKLVRLHMRPINLTDEGVTDSAVRRLGAQAGEHIDALLTLCRADVTSSDPGRVKKYLANFEKVVEHIQAVEEKDQLRSFQSPVRGEVIMAETGLEPGPLVGKLKKLIEEAILEGEIPNEYEAALEYLRKIKDDALDSVRSRPAG